MIITRTPYRISFMGGGTDYESWYSIHGGHVLTATIDKYCYVCLRKMPAFLGHKYLVFWSKMEAVDTLDEIQHPGVKGCLKYFGMDDGIEINHAGDLPARSGLGSSSAFTVGMLHALHMVTGDICDKKTLAREAIEVEQKVLHETVGIQDQIQCAYGGMNSIHIHKDGTYHIHQLLLDNDRLEDLEENLVLVFTGLQRYASEIASAQVDNIHYKTAQLTRIMDMVPIAMDVMQNGTIAEFGELLHESWMLKRELSSKVSNAVIDTIYATARKNGALGGKVLGAGGGGFMLFVAPPERHEDLVDGLLSIPVKFEHQGSNVVLS